MFEPLLPNHCFLCLPVTCQQRYHQWLWLLLNLGLSVPPFWPGLPPCLNIPHQSRYRPPPSSSLHLVCLQSQQLFLGHPHPKWFPRRQCRQPARHLHFHPPPNESQPNHHPTKPPKHCLQKFQYLERVLGRVLAWWSRIAFQGEISNHEILLHSRTIARWGTCRPSYRPQKWILQWWVCLRRGIWLKWALA